MKKLVLIVLAVLLYAGVNQYFDSAPVDVVPGDPQDTGAIDAAFAARQSNLQVAGRGTVARVLADDTRGSRHQRFIVRLASGLTVLVAHNIDLAPRVKSLQAGEAVAFYGEYEWNPNGGVIHWTHHDPRGRHPAGWIEYRGEKYR